MFFLCGSCVVSTEFGLILIGLFLVAMLYSSVGHGGGSGYLAVLSLTSYGTMEAEWLKQYAWSLNLIVAGIAFWHYQRAGHHLPKLTLPFVAASIPLAVLGGYMRVGGEIYDVILSIALLWAAWRLLSVRDGGGVGVMGYPSTATALPIGGAIGLASGITGVGGGIFLSPVLMLKKWATPKAAAATAALFIWLNSAAGLAGASLSGQIELDFGVLGSFAVVVMLGGFLGSRLGADVAPQRMVRRLLVAVLVIAAANRILEVAGV